MAAACVMASVSTSVEAITATAASTLSSSTTYILIGVPRDELFSYMSENMIEMDCEH